MSKDLILIHIRKALKEKYHRIYITLDGGENIRYTKNYIDYYTRSLKFRNRITGIRTDHETKRSYIAMLSESKYKELWGER